jgi:hypothetical protein
MKRNHRITLAVILVLTLLVPLFPAVSLATEIGLFYITGGRADYAPFTNDARFKVGFYQNSLPYPSGPVQYFIDLPLLDIKVGDSFAVTSGPDFQFAVNKLTDGLNEYIEIAIFSGGGFQGNDTRESELFWDDPNPASGSEHIDLSQSLNPISSITLTFTDVSFSTWSSPSVTLYDAFVRGYLEIDGEQIGELPIGEGIPEPSTMLLLGSGLIGLAGYGRKKLFKK